MEVLVGPTAYAVELEVSSSSAAAGGGGASFVNEREETSCLFLTGSENSSEISSSIGDPEDSDVEDDGDSGGDKNVEIASSKLSLDSLEDSLPIKRGLSNHFTGKSKSFTNLADVSSSSNTCSVKDLEKPENPFNKRRRVLIANKLARKSSFYSWQNPKSMPLLTVHEDQDHDDNEVDHQTVAEENDEDEEKKNQTRVCGNRLKKKITFKSHSCFSLADLHEEDEDDEHR